ncbi:MAG: AAA family ATPase [Planctomycetota bacterium]
MEREKVDEFIVRQICTGLIVSDDYIKHIARVYNKDCLESPTARTIASWCLDHYKKYSKAPGRDIEGIYVQKVKDGLPKEKAEWIENILEGLGEEYDREQFNVDFLLERTIKHFQECQAKVLHNQQRVAMEAGDIDEFYKLNATFKPITLADLFEDESVNAWELYKMDDTEVRGLVKDLIPVGLTILGGKSKVGKSYFMLSLAMALAQRKRMFGDKDTGFRGQRGEILYLSLEDPQNRFKRRMREIDPTPNPESLAENLFPKFRWDKLSRGGLSAISQWMEKAKNPKLVVIDTLAKVWSKKSTTGGGSLYAEEYAIYGPLADLAHKYETSIILVTHTTKGRAQDVFDEILGGMGTQGPADNLIVLSNEEAGHKRLSIRGKDIEEKHFAFKTSGGPANWLFLGEVAEVQKTAQRQEIIDLFSDEESAMSLQEIKIKLKERGCKISPNSVPTILRKMVGDGVLEQQSKYDKYHLAGYAGKKADSKVSQTLGQI